MMMSRFSLWLVLPFLITGVLIWWFLGSSHDEKNTWPKERPLTILAVGDSLTEGYGVPSSDSYPSQLEEQLKAYGYRTEVINAGISGDTTRGGLDRLRALLEEHTDLVLLGLGSNDALRLISPKETEENLRAMITMIREKGLPLILLGAKSPLNGGLAYRKEFDAIFPRLAKEFSLHLIPFILKDVALRPSLNIEDGIHPNKEGYTVMVSRHILPMVEAFLKDPSQFGQK